MSLFITFEGGEGSGKSYQSRTLYKRLNDLAIPALLTHEPGGTAAGEKIAHWLKWAHPSADGRTGISPLTELLMFNASRAQLVEEVIKPALQKGTVVICDRFTDSTIAYQGYGRGLSLETVSAINNTATQGLKPDLTILLDLPVESGLERKSKGKQDRFHKADLAFHKKVRRGYRKLAAEEPERWLIVIATQSKERIKTIIWERVQKILSISSPQRGRVPIHYVHRGIPYE